MKEKLLVVVVFCLSLTINMFAQKGYAEKINQLNEKGQKTGLWKEDTNNYWRTETYYQNGKKNGLFKSFSISRGELSCFGEYKNDIITGTWYYFGDFGHLTTIQKNFKKNDKPIPAEHRAQGVCPYQCYCINYYPNGAIKSEGILLYVEDPESDLTFEYGEWKYYADTGELTTTKIFK
jgi:antitoxin component YwqK of YwqJK toxin-antitoxin module